MKNKNIFVLSLFAGFCLQAAAQTDSTALGIDDFANQTIEIGAEKDFTREQSTASVSVITNNTDKRSAKNISNSIIGQGNGLISLQNGGTYFNANPTFYIRGLQSLTTNTPLILVDGIERDINLISPDEVDHVTILKDAAAVALYGYKGANGAIQVVTKRGKYNSKSIRVSYDHLINYQTNRPKFVNGYTYANAMNEALANEGQAPRYDENALAAFKSGAFPFQYPNVNWVDETFRHHGVTNKVGVEFSGGGERFRYYTMMNLLSDKGFVKNYAETDGYSTQDKYVRGNLRANLDIDLTPTTDLKVNILGILSEMSQPGNQADLWNMIYNVPSAAFPIKSETSDWGGNSTWAGTLNPVGQSSDAAYYKIHERALFADMTLHQDLSAFTEGLGMFFRLGYDTYSTLYENHSKSYMYGSYNVSGWDNGAPVLGDYFTGGERTEMSQDAATNTYARRVVFDGGLSYDRTFGKHSVYSQLKWNYDYENTTGTNTSIYRQNFSWWTHYGYDNRYLVDFSLAYTGSSRLAPGTKWAWSPTVSAAWVLSNEEFMKNTSWLDFLKLRASFGVISSDVLPGDNVWTYYTQSFSYSGASAYYFVDATAAQDLQGTTTMGMMATVNPTHEKAQKFNVGFDATLFKGLNIEFDYFFNHRYDIFVSGGGAYSALIGFDAPYVNKGVVNQHGFDVAVNYTKKFGDVQFNLGANMTLSKNTIKEQAEEPRAYENLIQTGNPLNSIYGLIAEGLFTSEEEIANSPAQTFSTVRVGDIKYKDVNGDNVIDANDKVRIGYSTACPKLFYSFHLGAEWKGLGFDAMFQGVGNYSAVLNTAGYYWGLINNSNLAQEVYDNRWSPENNDAHALYPRLSSSSNANNYQTSTYWLRDRSFLKLRNVELYYHLPQSLLEKTRIVNAAKVYLRGVDLFCFDHLDNIDAESYGAISPLTRSVVLGLSVTF